MEPKPNLEYVSYALMLVQETQEHQTKDGLSESRSLP